MDRIRVMAMAASLALTATANADDFQESKSHPVTCWNISLPQIMAGAKVEMTVHIKNGMVSTVDVTRYHPDNQIGFEAAEAAVRAVKACGPYEGLDGAVGLVLDSAAPATSDDTIPAPGTQS